MTDLLKPVNGMNTCTQILLSHKYFFSLPDSGLFKPIARL